MDVRRAALERELPGTLRRALRRVYDAGRGEHSDIDLDYEAFASGALTAIRSRLARSVGPPSSDDLAHALRTAAAEDLYLARSCEEGCSGSWERLHETLFPRLRGLARHRGADPGEAERLASEVLADLAHPPSDEGARTLLGTFAGRGSLFGWLAVILVRRMGADAKRKRPQTLGALVPEDPAGGGRPESREAADPAVASEVGETAVLFTNALRRVWTQLTERERLTLIFKYRDGLRQRVVARILGVGEPRVSRLVRQALEKLTAEAKGIRAGRQAWPAMTRALEDELARLGGGVPPPSGIELDGELSDGES